ncbi:hypothetical protein [Pseudomonas sp. TTU2014-080ASC]|uniref:hypothetical protein n=1 Tax=Pseudomonas sp. TTU2014-080ASC TaxID=1729724 RepID=UPI0013965DCF|nr:hypothetical protein [Pseudomonas sp. TTU2014-080ASC]
MLHDLQTIHPSDYRHGALLDFPERHSSRVTREILADGVFTPGQEIDSVILTSGLKVINKPFKTDGYKNDSAINNGIIQLFMA